MIFSFPSQEMQVCKALSTMAASTQEMLSGPNIVVHTGEICWALKHPWDWMTLAFLKANMGTLVLLHVLGKLSAPRASARPRRTVLLPAALPSPSSSLHTCAGHGTSGHRADKKCGRKRAPSWRPESASDRKAATYRLCGPGSAPSTPALVPSSINEGITLDVLLHSSSFITE